jgi:hypothetical protein
VRKEREITLLKRSIEYDDEATIEEIVLHYAKRICVVFAVAALTLGTLDLVSATALQNAAQYVHERHVTVAALPSLAVEGLRKVDIRFSPRDDEIALAIPRDTDDILPRVPDLASLKSAPSPLDGLVEARRKNAIEFAMATPAEPLAAASPMERLSTATAVEQLPVATPVASAPSTPPPIQLASLTPIALPDAAPSASLTPAPIKISLPTTLAMLPPPAPGVPPPTPIERLHLEGKALARAERCLANAVYFEARDQPFRGQVAVAQVVMNRVFSGFYPEDVCGVVYQNAHRHLACQFTFACDGKRKVINERGAWARANRIARQTLHGKLYEKAVGTATHYHALYVHPYWTREMHKLVRYGIHNFYRPIAWGNGSDEPVWSKLAMKKKGTH